MIATMLIDAEKKFESTKTFLTQELAVMRTSQVSPALIQDIEVSAYDGTYTLKELGAISLQDVSTLVIQVWDESVITGIEKALVQAQLGASPAVDGMTIRLAIPSISQEQRDAIIKTVKQKTEDAKVAVRNIRQDKNKAFDEMEENGKISEDENKRAKKDLQEMVDSANTQLETIRDNKIQALRS
ncbi:ribosome recycling factor [bacterium]|uniref:Ribosome recycling factor n=2 Tax=Katanobacteria TaxID=422282 RepID=A0A2M7WZQ3_UNCKA|nr:ribosome recycling factor [bacterium]PIP56095.1 MAG: ribosome recycling factor [candidate division WWE3 bacterium CG22_combo_CG10-13_8_21_14_all_39_12]PJA39098.1 MAG: ribosome recycling factor [candidate division WWE3 bacterium CG_4_9_14_3_um_filter_39_7]